MAFQGDGGVGWKVTFREKLSYRQLPRICLFHFPDKVRYLYERFGIRRLSEDQQAFEHGIRSGRGVVELALGDEQFRILTQT
jgi:hypothetical protein